MLAGLAVLTAVVVAVPAWAQDGADPYRPQQWGLERVRAEAAWDVSRGEGAVVAVVDSGVDLSHPDLRGRLLRDGSGNLIGRDWIEDDDLPRDEHGHGTMVAGIVGAGAGNGVGVAGTAPGVRIMPLRVLDEDGRGSSRDVQRAIRWAVDHGADVVNLSLESDAAANDGRISARAPTDAVAYAWQRGVPVVAAAGNSGNPFTDYPDSSPVLLVGATTRDDTIARFSDTGRDDAVVAPGMGIVSTWCRRGDTVCDGRTHTYGEAEGTSFAAPFVSAGLALLRASGRSPREAVRRLRGTARDVGPPGRDPQSGYGLIDLAAALRRPTGAAGAAASQGPRPAASPSPADTDSPPARPTATPTPPSTPEPAATADAPPTPARQPAGDGAGRTPTPAPAAAGRPPPETPGTPLTVLAVTLVALSGGLWEVARRRAV